VIIYHSEHDITARVNMKTTDQALRGLAEAFAAFARMLALFVLMVLTFVFLALAGLFRAGAEAFRILCSLVPALVRALAVCSVAVAMILAWPALFAAFGGDVMAALPATVFCVVPVAYMLATRTGLDGLLAAAAIVVLVGGLYPVLPVFAQGVVLAGVMGATVTMQIQAIKTGKEKDHEGARGFVLGVGTDSATVAVQRDEEHQPDIDHNAG
jgi:hypothetical protein